MPVWQIRSHFRTRSDLKKPEQNPDKTLKQTTEHKCFHISVKNHADPQDPDKQYGKQSSAPTKKSRCDRNPNL